MLMRFTDADTRKDRWAPWVTIFRPCSKGQLPCTKESAICHQSFACMHRCMSPAYPRRKTLAHGRSPPCIPGSSESWPSSSSSMRREPPQPASHPLFCHTGCSCNSTAVHGQALACTCSAGPVPLCAWLTCSAREQCTVTAPDPWSSAERVWAKLQGQTATGAPAKLPQIRLSTDT